MNQDNNNKKPLATLKNVTFIKRFCSNCGYRFIPVKRDHYCLECRAHHNQYLDYISMARGIGKRPVILPVSLKPLLKRDKSTTMLAVNELRLSRCH